MVFSWMIIHGTVYATINCHDQKFSPCYKASTLGSVPQAAVSAWIYKTQSPTAACAPPVNGDFCCKGNPCNPPKDLLLGSQYSNTEMQYSHFVCTFPEPPIGKRVSGSVFRHHFAIQTVSIYTITQSFLC